MTMIGDGATLERVAAAVGQLAPHRLPLYRAVCDGLIALVEPQRDAPVPSRVLVATGRPTILLIGDDDETPSGPDGWHCARRARKWGRRALIHAAGGDADHYRAAAIAVGVVGRLVLVETNSAHCDAWHRWLHPVMPGLVIGTRPGDVHPHLARRALQ